MIRDLSSRSCQHAPCRPDSLHPLFGEESGTKEHSLRGLVRWANFTHPRLNLSILFLLDQKDDGEDWDREINESWGKTPVYNPSPQLCVGVDVSGVELEKRNEFLSTLSAYPPASQAYTATATYESMARLQHTNSCNRYSIPHEIAVGQFEDAE